MYCFRQQKEAEATLSLLEEDDKEETDEMRLQEVNDLLRFAERELDAATYAAFVETMIRNGDDGVRGFCELSTLCQGHLEIQEMLLDILEPPQALQLGLSCYMVAQTRFPF